jgi:DNA-binding NtrC family response regulator
MRKKIWLIDDETEMLLVLAEFFQDRYDFQAFSSPEKLLDAVKSGHTPQVVISDFRMPKTNGIELYTELKRLGVHAPLILLSGFVDKTISLEAFNRGIYRVMEKPFSPKDIRNCVEGALAVEEVQETSRQLRETTHEFMETTSKLIELYRHRAEDAERLLKDLSLLPRPAGQQLERLLASSELQSRLNAIREQAIGTMKRIDLDSDENFALAKAG